MKRYASDKLNDHWADIINEQLGVEWSTRNQALDWGREAFADVAQSSLPCIQSFFNAWLLFETCFHHRSPDTHNNLLHGPLFFNPWVFWKPMVEDFSTYKWKVNKKEHPDPCDYGLFKNELRHLKVLALFFFLMRMVSSHLTR